MSDDCRVLALWIVQPTHKPDCKYVANSQIAHSVIHYPTGTTVLYRIYMLQEYSNSCYSEYNCVLQYAAMCVCKHNIMSVSDRW